MNHQAPHSEARARTGAVARPPGLGTPPLLDTLAWIVAPYPFLRFMSRRYGDNFRFRIKGQGDIVCFSHPDAIRQIFMTSSDMLQASVGNAILEPFLGNNSLLLLEGERHLRERRLMMPPFHGERMRHYGALIRACTHAVTAAWQPGRAFAAAPYMSEISLEIIIGAVFGITAGARQGEYKRRLSAAVGHLTGPMLFLPWMRRDLGPLSPGGRMARADAALRALLLEEMAERRAEADTGRQDIMTMLLCARDEQGTPMSDDELHDELLTLLLAGHETTGNALAWALAWIHHTPGVLERLRAELAPLGPEPDPDAASRLPYLDAVVREALRIKPIIPLVSRGVMEPMDIQGLRVEPGETVMAVLYLTHHREDLYPDPDTFRPERFLDRKFTPYEYLPFGGGIRRCLGMAFALYEMKIVLATLLSRFDLELANRLSTLAVRKSVAISPLGGARLRVRALR